MLTDMERWKEFKMDDVFVFSKGKRLTKADMLEGNLNYIGAISNNNGIRQFIDAQPTHKGNCITVNYNGSVGEAFYQKDDFWASDDVNVLYLKERELNRNIGLFLCTIIKANKYRFGYGRKWTLEKMKETTLRLPAKANGTINWNYIEQNINKIITDIDIEKRIKTNNKDHTFKLNTSNWRECRLVDWFDYERGTRLTKEDRVNGHIPLVTAGEGELGVKEFIGNEEQKKFSNSITIDMFCNSYTFIQQFYCDDNIIVLRPKVNINKYAMLFINTIIEKDKYRYQYGRQYRQKNLKNHTIMLPAKHDGTPDWLFMENYIKQLPYADKI